MIKKLQRQIMVTLISVGALFLIVILGYLLYSNYSSFQQANQQKIEQIQSQYDMKNNKPENDRLPRSDSAVVIVDSTGSMQLMSNSLLLVDDDTITSIVSMITSADSSLESTLEQYDLIYSMQQHPDRTIIVLLDVDVSKQVLNNQMISSIGILILALVLFSILSYFLSKWLVKPIAKAWKDQQQFVSNASHDLKTPLAVVNANVGLLKSNQLDDKERNTVIENSQVELKRMSSLINSMLQLAKGDITIENNETIELSKADMSQLLNFAIATFEPLAFEKQLSIQESIEPSLCVNANEKQLQQVVDILLDNAIKYSEGNSPIEVLLYKQKKAAILEVKNGYHSIIKQQLDDLFKRFYRLDESRNEVNGFGLGLAIAKDSIESMKGKIWVTQTNNQIIFHVKLNIAN